MGNKGNVYYPETGDTPSVYNAGFENNAELMDDQTRSISVISDGVTDALDITGKTIYSNDSTETDENRPVSWSYFQSIKPASIPSQVTDFHGVDIFASVGIPDAGDMSDVTLYPFESKSHFSSTGTLDGIVAGFLEAGNRAGGDVNDITALRLRSENVGTGSVDDLYGIRLDTPRNGGTVQESYGIYLADLRVGSVKNYAIFSLGGDVYFVGDLKLAGTGILDIDGKAKLNDGIRCELPEYADRTAAINGGLFWNDFYRTGDIVKVLYQ